MKNPHFLIAVILSKNDLVILRARAFLSTDYTDLAD